MKNDRWLALDFFKAIAVLIMAVGHSLVFWFSPNDHALTTVYSSSDIYFLSLFIKIAEIFPMTLPITAGVSFRFILNNYWTPDGKIRIIKNKEYWFFIKRAFTLMALGFLMNYLAWGIRSGGFFAWDVLQFIPLCIFITVIFLRYFSIKWLFITGAVIFVATPAIRNFYFVNVPFDNIYKIILIGDVSGNHYWPLLPWISIFILGLWIGELKINYSSSYQVFTKYFLVIGLLGYILFKFFGIGEWQVDPGNVYGPNLFMPSSIRLFMLLFKFLILFSIGCYIFSFIKSMGRYNIINVYSKEILLIYVFHTVISYHLAFNLLKYNYHSYTFFIVYIAVQPLMAYLLGILFMKIKRTLTPRKILE